VKTRILSALALIALLILPGCSWLKSTGKAAAKGAIGCLTSEAVQAADELGPLLRPAVVQTFASGKPDTAPFVALGKRADSDLVRCAIASTFAAVAAGLDSTPRTHAQQIDPVAVRAAFRQVSAEAFGGATFQTPSGAI
jgi:hypothetical protein